MQDTLNTLLPVLLPAYFILYFGIAFVLRSVIVARRIGKNPLVLPKDDTAYGLIGRYFKLTLIAMFAYVAAYALFPSWHPRFLPITYLQHPNIVLAGLATLLVAFLWTAIAQIHMKESWRIGIDTEVETELMTQGLFSISRNPIFLGMILALLGLFLCTPNALTMLFLILGTVLIQIQVRLEEDHLTAQHGQRYQAYRGKVRRFI